MKTLILADVHNQWKRADKIINYEAPDLTIFTGDYFDDKIHNEPEHARKTALWLKDSLLKKNRIHLIGNHDAPYYFHNNYMTCSGYTPYNDAAINEVLTPQDWAKLSWYYIHNGILFTHAGLHPQYYRLRRDRSLETFLKQEASQAFAEASKPWGKHWFFMAGAARGGYAEYGGLTWLDFEDEFSPIPEVPQVFGHTRQQEPAWKGNSVCADTGLNFYLTEIAGKIKVGAYRDI